MKSYPGKKVCVFDLGLFVFIAEALVPHFDEVFYYSPGKQSPFPKRGVLSIGDGVPGITRVNAWEPLLMSGEVDLWVFPDSLCGETSDLLRYLGQRVWGAGMVEVLEQDRVEAKRYMAECGLKIGKWETVKGVDALHEYLKKNEGVYVKTSLYRGDIETFRAKSEVATRTWINKTRHELGPLAQAQEFVIEQPIPDCVEIGYDGYTVDGQFPSLSLFGIETKGIGYLGTFKEYRELPKQIRDGNAAMSTLLAENHCRSFFGMEMRVDKKGVAWVVDPMARFGSPPGELCSEIYSNLAEIFWEGADGKIVDPKPAAKWGASIQLHSNDAEDQPVAVAYPEEFAANVKLRNFYQDEDGQRWVMPQPIKSVSLGAAVGLGDTMEESMALAKEVAESIDCLGLEFDAKAPEEAKEAFAALARLPGRLGPTASPKGGL